MYFIKEFFISKSLTDIFLLLMEFSVLLSVYHKEKAEYLRQCFESIYNQTLLPSEVILVEDGKLTDELYKVISELTYQHKNIKVISYKENQGLGFALNLGLEHCSHEYVARMDTDDINFPQRFEEQVKFLTDHSEYAAVSAWIEEFDNDIKNIISIRKIPEFDKENYEFAKSRNPINHPVVMFRKQSVLDAGGYIPFPQFEDYFLWVRMLLRGAKIYNIQHPLLHFRRSLDMIQRRGGRKYAVNEFLFQKELHKLGYISRPKMIKNILIRMIVRIIPNNIRNFIYSKFLRD